MWVVFSWLLLLCVPMSSIAAPPTPPQQPPPPPPEVSVMVVHAQSIPIVRETVGRLAPTRVAEVRARVAGIVQARAYTEGTDVSVGQVLFRIDPAPLEAALHAAQATLAKAEADAANAALTAKRYSDLHAKNLLAQQDLDTALANERTTAAVVKQAQANLEIAHLNLGYATVVAPIAGRAGRAMVTEGALVGQGSATELTTVEQIDPIYVNFSQSVADFTQMPTQPVHSQLEVFLPEGSTHLQTGTVDFSDLAVTPTTGTVSLRGVLPNPGHWLLPGMFVRVRLTAGSIDHAFSLPQAAVLRDNTGAYVLVVGASGAVEQRRIETRTMTNTDWVVTGGLTEGDQVIVDGLLKVRPGATANAVSLR